MVFGVDLGTSRFHVMFYHITLGCECVFKIINLWSYNNFNDGQCTQLTF